MVEKAYVTLKIEMEQDLYDQVCSVCKANNMTPEDFIVRAIDAFVRCGGFPFSVTKEELDRMRTEPPRVKVYELREDENGNITEISLD